MADTLADNLKEVNIEKMSETLTYLKATSPVVTLAPTLAEIKAMTAGKTLSDTGQIPVVTPSAIVGEVLEKTFKSESMGAPGRCATCYLSDFNETWPV